jgi:pilus assembly protein CpaE
MSNTLRICLFDPNGQKGNEFRVPFGELSGAVVAAEPSDWDDLREWIKHSGVDVVVVNLDDEAGQGLEVVQRLGQLAQGCGIIGVSENSDPAHIISAMRAGCSQFVCWPVDPEDLSSAVERIRATRRVATASSKRICVVGSSGGAGATMVACNLALELGHLSDRHTALIDLNLEFGDVGCAFDCTPKFSVADVCKAGIEADRLLLGKAMHELPCNVSILPRPERIEEAREVTPDGVETLLRVVAELHPYIVVDLPRAFSFLSAAALRDADHVLIVTQLGVPFIRNASRIYQCLLEMGAEEERIDIILNRCKANFERISPEEVESHFGRPIFAMIPNDYRRVQTALDFGHPIMADSPSSPARVAIQEIARKIASDETGEKHSTVDSGGLLGRFWRRKPGN